MMLILKKRETYRRLLHEWSEASNDEYKRRSYGVKRAIKRRKRVAVEEWGRRVSDNFTENKIFWKEVRKEMGQVCRFIKDTDSELVRGKEEVKGRWREYFEDFLNFRYVRETELSYLSEGELPRERR